jgi:hypothetical protein
MAGSTAVRPCTQGISHGAPVWRFPSSYVALGKGQGRQAQRCKPRRSQVRVRSAARVWRNRAESQGRLSRGMHRCIALYGHSFVHGILRCTDSPVNP